MASVFVRKPTISRYKNLFLDKRDISILRRLEYERLSNLELAGKVLDFGGGSIINYADEISGWANKNQEFIYESANIDPKTKPTYLISDGKVPVGEDYYDTVLSFNTFEHIYNLEQTIIEIRRLLKSGGELIFIVPFIFRVHGHPDDYLRGTPSFWNTFLIQHNFKHVKIEALTWGPYSTAFTIAGIPLPFKNLWYGIALVLDVIYFKKHHGNKTIVSLIQDDPVCNVPLGYIVTSSK